MADEQKLKPLLMALKEIAILIIGAVEDFCETSSTLPIRTEDKALAKQMADHHFALAQVYLKMAGEQPRMTGSQMRKMVENANR